MASGSHVFQLYRLGDDTAVWWRLISSNGRGLARAAQPLAGSEQAQRAIARIIDALPDTESTIHVDDAFRWRWTLELHGVAVVVSAVQHDRRTRCLQACRRFAEIAPTTPVDAVVLAFPAVGSRVGTVVAPRVAGPFVPRSPSRGRLVVADGFDRRAGTAREGR